MFSIKNIFLNHSGIYFICSLLLKSAYQFIDGENDSREAFKRSTSVDII